MGRGAPFRIVLAASAALVAAAAPAAGAADCAGLRQQMQRESGHILEAQGLMVGYRLLPPAPTVEREFAVEVHACTAAGTPAPGPIVLDADMPGHGHGMIVTPKALAAGPGRMRFEGMKFHMQGAWRLIIKVGEGAKPQRLTDSIFVGW